MFAGMDWSGTPDRRKELKEPDLYVACCVVAPDVLEADEFLDNLRKRRSKPYDYEFKGYHSKENDLLELIEYVVDKGSVNAVTIDKSEVELSLGAEVFKRPDNLTIATGRLILNQAFRRGAISCVWCDEELSKENQKRFNTLVQRDAQSLGMKSPKIKRFPSHKSTMIQLADVVAYALWRDTLNRIASGRLQSAVKQVRGSGNFVRRGYGEDLRSYL